MLRSSFVVIPDVVGGSHDWDRVGKTLFPVVQHQGIGRRVSVIRLARRAARKHAAECSVEGLQHIGKCAALRGAGQDSRSDECLGESAEHHKVGMKLHPLQPANPERREAVVHLQWGVPSADR